MRPDPPPDLSAPSGVAPRPGSVAGRAEERS
jgi:hypothetical protein